MPPRSIFPILLGWLITLSSCERSSAPPKATDPAQKITGDLLMDLEPVAQGRRLKIAWVQSAQPNTADTAASGKDLRLMGIDSTDGRGMVPLTKASGSYFRPLISPDGERVIYTDRSGQPEILALGWKQGDLTDLGAGVAVGVWRDPALSNVWIYALEEVDQGARDGLFGKRLVRFQIDKPAEREIVWAQTPIDADGFQLSRDGLRASALLPSPEASQINFSDSTWKKLASGSWPALAPDNSYLEWTLDADRSILNFFQPNAPEPWQIQLRAVAGIGQGNTIWHPRWGNNVGVITFTGPYPQAPNHPNYKAATDGTKAEIFVARLSAGASDILSLVQITHNDRGDAYPDVWMENSHLETLANFPQAPPDAVAAQTLPWPTKVTDLQFAFINAVTDSPIPTVPPTDPAASTRLSRLTGKQSARFDRNWGLDVSRGYFVADAITNQAIATACRAQNAFTVEGIFYETRDSYQQPLSVRLAGFRGQDGKDLLGLYRVDNALVLRVLLGTDSASAKVYPLKLANFRIDSGRPYHLVVTLDQLVVRTYVDSSMLSEVALEATGLAAWGEGAWELGDPNPMGGNDWTGLIHHTAFYSRALASEEVAQNFNAIQPLLANRKVADRIKLQGTLEAITPLSKSVEASPYTRILTSRTYRVAKLEAGFYSPQYIVVLHDAALNRHPVPDLPNKLGETYSLLVEPAAQHFELKVAEVLNETPLTNDPLYLEVTPPPRLP